MAISDTQPQLVLPQGTKVLTRVGGSVGVISHSPDAPGHNYRVRFADGREATFKRADLSIFRHAQAEIPASYEQADLYSCVIYRCIVGSRAYGLDQEDSDTDRRGFYLPPAELHWSLAGVPEQLENDNEEVYWELEKFLRLALKANPNVLECLYSPIIEVCNEPASELIGIRNIFLSQYVHRTYNAYVLSQFKKIEQDLRNHDRVRWKHVMHLIRLLLSGVAVLRHGFVPLRVDEYRDRLLAIRAGEVPWVEVEKWRLSLHKELDDALSATKLPEHPDYERANTFLLHARRLAAGPGYLR
ncbi:MAG TPA: nucleotidyltransferase domain-containing protein [Candidatus Limnocylindrales bacterium]|nr:nucleotidyltransferase domain-containing protein [Candidatus Limnocylindrales bacterium]